MNERSLEDIEKGDRLKVLEDVKPSDFKREPATFLKKLNNKIDDFMIGTNIKEGDYFDIEKIDRGDNEGLVYHARFIKGSPSLETNYALVSKSEARSDETSGVMLFDVLGLINVLKSGKIKKVK